MTFCPQCPTKTVVDPPVRIVENVFHPQVVQVVHPIEVIKQHHCVPVFHHTFAFAEKDVMCSSAKTKKRSKKR